MKHLKVVDELGEEAKQQLRDFQCNSERYMEEKYSRCQLTPTPCLNPNWREIAFHSNGLKDYLQPKQKVIEEE